MSVTDVRNVQLDALATVCSFHLGQVENCDLMLRTITYDELTGFVSALIGISAGLLNMLAERGVDPAAALGALRAQIDRA